MGSLWGLKIRTGPTWVVLTKTHMAPAQAHMKSTYTCLLWKHRGHACVIEIRFLKHTENPVKNKACIHATMHVEGG